MRNVPAEECHAMDCGKYYTQPRHPKVNGQQSKRQTGMDRHPSENLDIA